MRDAGISVISTLNIQHLESLNEVVQQITGVRVRETIPDAIVDSADEIELEDLTPDAVLNRLRRGDIYREEKITQALANFFRRENIVALRELALRKTAEEVDTDLAQVMAGHLTQAKAARPELIVVLVAGRPLAPRLLRRGYRLATRLQGEFVALHVRVPGAALTAQERACLRSGGRHGP